MFRILSPQGCDVLLMPLVMLLQQGHHCRSEEQKRALEDNIEFTDSPNTTVTQI